jgi:hypothetical protein
MYQEMAALPTLKSKAVTMAPGHTSCHAIVVSGNHLNNIANSTPSEVNDHEQRAGCRTADP